MLIKATYLNHYCGTSRADPANAKERACWAEVEVDVPYIPKWQLQQVLHDDDGYHASYESNRAYSYDGHYWAVFEAAFGIQRVGLPTEKHSQYSDFGTEKSDFRNYSKRTQKAFAWTTFEYGMFCRVPGAGVYATDPPNYRGYKPAVAEWDDRTRIEAKAKLFYERNLIVGDDTVFCRIEAPVLAETPSRELWGRGRFSDVNRILTPYGGHGDPVVDFDAAHENILRIGDNGRSPWHRETRKQSFFAPIPGYEFDGTFRRVRAIVSNMFSRRPISPAQSKKGESKQAKTLQQLWELWSANFGDVDETVLDEAAELMLKINPKAPYRNALESWLDRPIVATLGFPGSKMAAAEKS